MRQVQIFRPSSWDIVSANNPTPKPSMKHCDPQGPLATPAVKVYTVRGFPAFDEIL